ncbi:hypothetical protein TOPH_07937 [Tolypocladium ophioglossoides CBS 100239]|uniref:Uncharacterized protein n=1 Tax=Tolypocladium ophioglossoides (strain CBS 100239) TaxID=1163406 RepID=A0A0L0N095_TOLOC|nr:hypothetical protein TOPH_07937 [Tolypocladium ophioglossoides CBS 100239]
MALSQAPTHPFGCLELLPDKDILAIMESLTTYQDVRRLTFAYGRAYHLYRRHKYSVLSRINDRVVSRSNMDIAFITFAILRIHVDDLPQAIASMTSIVEKPHLVAKHYLNDYVLQREFLLLASRVNRLCETYTRVKNPEPFWRQLAYKFAAFCPDKDGKEPVMSAEAANAGRDEIASQCWDVFENVRRPPGDHHEVEPLPQIKHSRDMLESILRSFWAHELCCRYSIVEDLNEYLSSDALLWICDEMPTPGVRRFLHLMVDILAQRAVIHRVDQYTFSSPNDIASYDRFGLWSNIYFLGVRAWAVVVEKPRESLGWPTVDALQKLATQVLRRYAANRHNTAYWYYSIEMQAWRVKRLAVLGLLDGQPLALRRGMFERDRAEDGGDEEDQGHALDESQDASESESQDESQEASDSEYRDEALNSPGSGH